MSETTNENPKGLDGSEAIETHLAYDERLRKEQNNPEFQKEVEIAKKLIKEDPDKAAEMWALNKIDSLTDTLTNLPNRRHFKDTLKKEISDRIRMFKNGIPITPLCLIFLDSNKLKEVNSMGHDIGDKYLICLANTFKQEVRKTDFVARLGGDEFTIIYESPFSEADKLVTRLSSAFNITRQQLKLPNYTGFKANIAEWNPEQPETVEQFVKRADIYRTEDKK